VFEFFQDKVSDFPVIDFCSDKFLNTMQIYVFQSSFSNYKVHNFNIFW